MLSALNKKWIFSEPPSERVDRLKKDLDISTFLAELLVNRKIDDPEEARYFLSAELDSAHDPFLMCGMDVAVQRIVQAIRNRETITVYGDYDVDGVTSAALMVHFFRELGAPFDYYLPNRMEEGYGLNEKALDSIKSRGSTLVITADTGVTAIDQVDYANHIGVDVIVTDHHQLAEEGLPKALAVLNPHRPDCVYPFKFLSGVGIVFKLAAGIRRGLLEAGWDPEKLPNLKKHLDLFTLGTIADMAPLVGENHVLTSHGLETVRRSAKPGLIALKAIAGIEGKVDSAAIGFGLGPRLNAAGRLGKPDKGLRLLVASDLNEAMAMAQSLDAMNEERKKTQQGCFEEAEYLLERQVDLDEDKIIVLASENFHQGVIGIVASKLAEKFYRPAILIAVEDGVGKGSARSIPAFNLVKALNHCSDHLIQFGGHAYAAGLNIEDHRIDEFRKQINQVGRQYLTEEGMVPEVNIDGTLEMRNITEELFRDMQTLEPFGQMNKVPVFFSRGIRARDVRFVGREEKHVRFTAYQENHSLKVIGFNLAHAFKTLDSSEPIDVVYQLHRNNWNGRESLELKLLDVRSSHPED
ncbi:MAG: single-stranded-DNA-specific exonuclease RecJ [Nitrospinaceae bacterium]|nr:single-stranded-DNA-specific exonuclease RecJ [Nitrospinaceae bacterium]NIR55384.1 single-stranded-DNA-specific exonuclease RecJ [Nitrospinaceae bacterium]NIS85821.1 single-stranded-DNA-specific exonuclease RecJ [Nitrospinaceae bacterium]NIT82670.1 single-stranded-DNA-specific exonuclease RecJ [Nitrospinaceae bacterium]NIU44878.1 single-stranded-DNA-specific exonuclease RecJ [Nitrospinaceae bacterium]